MKLPDILDAGCACLREGWPDGHPALASLTSLRERLRGARLQVAVLGQFKRGKSTFLNALLGAPLLPSAVVPATAIPTFIGWAPAFRVRAAYQDGRPPEDEHPTDAAGVRERLHRLVTEEGNPLNRQRIARVDLFVPADILRDGIVLIDTPGIGSTLKHNTDAALQVLPECDAALFVVSADPPITEAEAAYLSKVRQHVVRLFFVLNKIDYLSQQEQADALAFLQTALHRSEQAGNCPRIFPLSARQALDARAGQDAPAFEASGLMRIERDVLQALAREKVAALGASVRAKAAASLGQALSDLRLQVRALELPLEDLERRAHSLEEALRSTEEERRSAQDLLQGDRRRAIAELEIQAERLRQDGRRHLTGVILRVVEEDGAVLDRSALQRALDAAIPLFFEARLVEVASDFRRAIEAMLARHYARVDALVGSVRHNAATLFDVPQLAAEETESFRLGPEPYWATQGWSNALMPAAATLLTRMLPAKLRRKRLQQEAEAQVSALVQQNVENLRWATLRGVDETFRRSSALLDARLADVLAVTQGSIRRAIECRQSEAGETAAELQRLDEVTGKLEGCLAALEGPREV